MTQRSQTVADLYDDEIFDVLVSLLDIANRLTAHAAVRRPCDAARLTSIGALCDELRDSIIDHWVAQASAEPPPDDLDGDEPVFEEADDLNDDSGTYRRP